MMDLEEKCPHCTAKKGEICSENCDVNGKYIKELHKILDRLDLRLVAMQLYDSIRYTLMEKTKHAGPEKTQNPRESTRGAYKY